MFAVKKPKSPSSSIRLFRPFGSSGITFSTSLLAVENFMFMFFMLFQCNVLSENRPPFGERPMSTTKAKTTILLILMPPRG